MKYGNRSWHERKHTTVILIALYFSTLLLSRNNNKHYSAGNNVSSCSLSSDAFVNLPSTSTTYPHPKTILSAVNDCDTVNHFQWLDFTFD